MLQKRRTALAQVYRHIQDTALDYAHQFGLAVGALLIMQAAQHASRALRLIVLYKMYGSHHAVELFLAESFHKISAGVAKNLGLQYKYAFNMGFYVFHFFNKYKPAQR